MHEKDLAEVYAARFGFTFEGGLLMDDFLAVIKQAVQKSGAYFVLKIDCENGRNMFTFDVGDPNHASVDTDNLDAGMRHAFRRLEQMGAY